MRLSACIDIMMRDLSIPERIAQVKAAGMDGVEFWSWENKDTAELKDGAKQHGIEIAAFCTRFCSLVDPQRRAEYLEGLKASIPIARELNCTNLITQTGAELPDVSREDQKESLIAGLRECVPLLEDNGITLLVEPLNILVDHKGYFLYRSEEAFEIIRAVDSPYVKVLYDVYHQQITEGNLIPTIQENIDLIGHFHVADHPGRTEPGTGEINYRRVFEAIAETGYDGWVGMEFRPTIAAVDALRQVVALAEGL